MLLTLRETCALQEMNVKLTKIGRQLQAYHADLQEIKAALQQHKLQTPVQPSLDQLST